MALGVARVVGAVLPACLTVLESTLRWRTIAVLSAGTTELVLSAVLTLLLIVALIVVATVLRWLVVTTVTLRWVLVVRVRHVDL